VEISWSIRRENDSIYPPLDNETVQEIKDHSGADVLIDTLFGDRSLTKNFADPFV